MRVRNTGAVAGDEIVQLYVRDDVASISPPVKQLKRFQKITLEPGAEQTVRFELPVADLSFLNDALHEVVEPGSFTVWAGPDSTGGLQARFVVEG